VPVATPFDKKIIFCYLGDVRTGNSANEELKMKNEE
jgi:hypothetical protein